jgi:glycosyltransferase involved in cell wall biosynthesis
MTDESLLSVILRFHNPERLVLLDEAIFSLALQDWSAIEIIVVIQNGDHGLQRRVCELIERQPWIGSPRHQVLLASFPPGVDGRSSLLNLGIAAARGRYLAFLDDDDYVYQHGYRVLIGALRSGRAVIAAGGCRVALTRRGRDHWYTHKKRSPYDWGDSREDLFTENFMPIHSYVIDRSRLDPADLRFDDLYPPLEDYEFLLRMAVKYPFDFSRHDLPVCEYRFHEDNSLQYDRAGEPVSSPKILRAKQLIAARKESLTVTYPLNQLLALRQQPLKTPTVNQDLLVELLTRQNRSLHKLVDRIYDFAERRKRLISLSVKCTRTTRSAIAMARRLLG